MLYTLRQLQHLVAIADSGRISAAAKDLHISQPALSASIKQLEHACGTDLFVRHKARGVSLTGSGRNLVIEARRLITHALELENYVNHLDDTIDGRIEIGCFTTLAPLWIPRMLVALGKRYPTLEVGIHEEDIRPLHTAILDGRIETALSYDLDIPAGLQSIPLAKMETYALLSKQHPLAGQQRLSLRELRDESLVLLDLPHSRAYFQSVFDAVGFTPQVAHRTVSFEMVRCMVANGHGYSVLNQKLATSVSYDGGELVMKPLVDTLPTLNVVLLFLRDTRLTRRTQAVIAFCREFYCAR